MTTETSSISKTRILNELIQLGSSQGGEIEKSLKKFKDLYLDLDRIERITGFKFGVPSLDGFDLIFQTKRIEGSVITIRICPLQMGLGTFSSFYMDVRFKEENWRSFRKVFGCGGELTRVGSFELITGSYVFFQVSSPFGIIFIELRDGSLSVKSNSTHFSVDRLAAY